MVADERLMLSPLEFWRIKRIAQTARKLIRHGIEIDYQKAPGSRTEFRQGRNSFTAEQTTDIGYPSETTVRVHGSWHLGHLSLGISRTTFDGTERSKFPPVQGVPNTVPLSAASKIMKDLGFYASGKDGVTRRR